MAESPCWPQWDTLHQTLGPMADYCFSFLLAFSSFFLVFLFSDIYFSLLTCFINSHHVHVLFIFPMSLANEGDHRQIPWISVTVGRIEIRRCAQWFGCNLESASRRLGTNLGIHGLLRGFSGSVCWNSCCSRRLWIQGLDSIRPSGENQKVKCRVGERPSCNDGYHRHVLSGDAEKQTSQADVAFVLKTDVIHYGHA